MNLFNRIVVIILCLALVGLALAIIALAWSIPNETISWLRDATGWMSGHNEDLEKTLLTTAGGLIALLALIIFLMELTPSSGTDVKVTDLRVGDAVLSTAAISQRVEEAVRAVPHVADAKATVKAKRKGVLVWLDLHVDPDANLAAVTDESCQAASDVLTERVHVALAEPPHARLHYRELRLHGRTARPAIPAVSERTMGPAPAVVTEPAAEASAGAPASEAAEAMASATTSDPTAAGIEERNLET